MPFQAAWGTQSHLHAETLFWMKFARLNGISDEMTEFVESFKSQALRTSHPFKDRQTQLPGAAGSIKFGGCAMKANQQTQLFEIDTEPEESAHPQDAARLVDVRLWVPDRTQPTYQVTPYTSKGKVAGYPVWLKAASVGAAERGGRALLKMLGQKGKFHVSARPYSPLHDPAFRGYVRPI